MSVYSDISKSIGWDPPERLPEIPDIEKAKGLMEQVVHGDRRAFTEVFRIHRFAKSPETPEAVRALDFIVAAFVKGREVFQRER